MHTYVDIGVPPHCPDLTEVAERLKQHHLLCLAWTHEGKSANDIGRILGISGRTVEKHLANACLILGVRTRIQAVVRARELGLLRRRDGTDVAYSVRVVVGDGPRME